MHASQCLESPRRTRSAHTNDGYVPLYPPYDGYGPAATVPTVWWVRSYCHCTHHMMGTVLLPLYPPYFVRRHFVRWMQVLCLSMLHMRNNLTKPNLTQLSTIRNTLMVLKRTKCPRDKVSWDKVPPDCTHMMGPARDCTHPPYTTMGQ